MTTAQIRAIIEPRKYRRQFDRGVKLYVVEMLNMLDIMYPDAEFEEALDIQNAIIRIGGARHIASDRIIYERLLPRAEADRAKRKGEAPPPWYSAMRLQKEACEQAELMIMEAALFLERLARRGAKVAMKDGRGISNEFIARVRQGGHLIANKNEYEYRDGMVIAWYEVAGKKSVEPRVIAVDCPTWLRTVGYIKVWPPKELESGVHRIE